MIYDMLYIHLNMKMKILVLKLLWNITRIPRYMDIYMRVYMMEYPLWILNQLG